MNGLDHYQHAETALIVARDAASGLIDGRPDPVAAALTLSAGHIHATLALAAAVLATTASAAAAFADAVMDES